MQALMSEPLTELDRLDPAPAGPGEQPPPCPDPAAHLPRRRPAARRRGAVEKAVLADIAALPPEYRKGAIAAAALLLGRELDLGGMTPRDAAGHAAQLRQCIVQLREWAPGEVPGDATDAARTRIEETRLRAVE
jgi:hypothetical protein